MIFILNIIPAIVISLTLQLLIHELGHMAGGLITGWHFLYLQLLHIVICKEEKRYYLKLVNTCCCQCVMYPSFKESGALLYTAGGCMFNLIGSVAGLMIMILYHYHIIIFLYVWSFCATGLILFLHNAIPNTKRICNDGACFQFLKQDKQTQLSHNLQFFCVKQLYEGKSYGDINEEYLCLPENKADNDILAYQLVLEYYHWLDLEEYERMQKGLHKIELNPQISGNVKDIILLERLYMEVLQKLFDMDLIPINEAFYEGNITKYIRVHETKGDIHSIRIKATYEIYERLMQGENEEAMKIINDAMKDVKGMKGMKGKKGINQGEEMFCIRQLEKLKVLCS